MLSTLRSLRWSGDFRRPVTILAVVTVTLGLAAVLGWAASLLVFVAVLSVVSFATLAANSDLGLPLMVCTAFLVPLEFEVSESVSINLVMLVLPVVVVIWALRRIVTKDMTLRSSRTFTPLLLLLAVALVSWAYGEVNWDLSFPRPGNLVLVQFGQWAIYALSVLAFIFAAHQSFRSLIWATYTFIGLGVLAMIVRYGGPLASLISRIVSPKTYGNGSFFVWLTVLAAGQALFNRRLHPAARAALMVLAAAVPILGFLQNREWASSWQPPLLGLLVVMWLRTPSRLRRIAFLAGLALFAVAISGVFLRLYDWQTEREFSIGGRFILWEAVLRLAMRQPILGLGLTTYRQYHRWIPLLTEHGRWMQPNVNSHNLYIDLIAQMGIVGLLVFLWGVVEISRLCWRLRNRYAGDFQAAYVASAAAGGVAMLVASAIVEWLLPFVYNVGFAGLRISIFSWIFLGGLVALQFADAKKHESAQARLSG